MEPRACTCHADDAALEILGAPIFDDSTGGSNWCLKRCDAKGALVAASRGTGSAGRGSSALTFARHLGISG
jgi:hypothetical protein